VVEGSNGAKARGDSWPAFHRSMVHASPLVFDFDFDNIPDILVATYDGDILFFKDTVGISSPPPHQEISSFVNRVSEIASTWEIVMLECIKLTTRKIPWFNYEAHLEESLPQSGNRKLCRDVLLGKLVSPPPPRGKCTATPFQRN